MKIAWVTDTAALLSKEFIEHHNIHVLPLNVVFEEGALRETVDMTSEEFYKKLREAKVHPKTSQPNFGEQVALYEKLKQEGYDFAIAIHTSGKQSGTVASAPIAAEQAGFKTYAIDAKIGSFPMQKMLELGIELARQSVSAENIVEEIIEMRSRSQLSFIPASLENLHKSGRVSGSAMFLSNLLNIKLVISYIDDGTCVVTKKVRADKRAKKEIVDTLDKAVKQSGVEQVAIIHCNNEMAAQEWKEELLVDYPSIEFILTPLSAAVGVHAGEGTIGLTWVRKK
ncbi:DegV family protein [Lysinibacillus sp. 54212]|uniref:DegV family protein n=1 Tax=Lysinibacillus sp. 54212 TaxID=3119829 RepID=UPI002FC76536